MFGQEIVSIIWSACPILLMFFSRYDHLKRDRSFAVDIFQGQLRSEVTCRRARAHHSPFKFLDQEETVKQGKDSFWIFNFLKMSSRYVGSRRILMHIYLWCWMIAGLECNYLSVKYDVFMYLSLEVRRRDGTLITDLNEVRSVIQCGRFVGSRFSWLNVEHLPRSLGNPKR